jgi:hypothetical protein
MSTEGTTERMTLCDVLDRVLNKGVVIHGDITIAVAGVDLLHISLRGLISAVDVIERDMQAALDKNLASRKLS